MAPLLSPTDDARDASAQIARLSGRDRHDVALVLGSGWSEVVAGLAERAMATGAATCTT